MRCEFPTHSTSFFSSREDGAGQSTVHPTFHSPSNRVSIPALPQVPLTLHTRPCVTRPLHTSWSHPTISPFTHSVPSTLLILLLFPKGTKHISTSELPHLLPRNLPTACSGILSFMLSAVSQQRGFVTRPIQKSFSISIL